MKLLLFLDVGGSMDPFIKLVEELFSAATSEFKKHGVFLFPQLPLRRRVGRTTSAAGKERTKTWDVLHKYGHDYKIIFVGDAAMSPYEVTHPGGSVEQYERGGGRGVVTARDQHLPCDRVAQSGAGKKQWNYSQSTKMIKQLVGDRMYPLTLDGLDDAMRELSRKHGA